MSESVATVKQEFGWKSIVVGLIGYSVIGLLGWLAFYLMACGFLRWGFGEGFGNGLLSNIEMMGGGLLALILMLVFCAISFFVCDSEANKDKSFLGLLPICLNTLWALDVCGWVVYEVINVMGRFACAFWWEGVYTTIISLVTFLWAFLLLLGAIGGFAICVLFFVKRIRK